MSETTKETLGRLARAIRTEADELEHRHREQFKELRASIPSDRDYQKGRMDGLREAAHALDEGN